VDLGFCQIKEEPKAEDIRGSIHPSVIDPHNRPAQPSPARTGVMNFGVLNR